MVKKLLDRYYQEFIGSLTIADLIIFLIIFAITDSISVIIYPIIGLFLIAMLTVIIGMFYKEPDTDNVIISVIYVLSGLFLTICCVPPLI